MRHFYSLIGQRLYYLLSRDKPSCHPPTIKIIVRARHCFLWGCSFRMIRHLFALVQYWSLPTQRLVLVLITLIYYLSFSNCLVILVVTSKAGTDFKSILINLASAFLFVMPIIIYFNQDRWQKIIGAVAGAFLLAFVAPPLGWKRPHPYSDNPANRPYPRKGD